MDEVGVQLATPASTEEGGRRRIAGGPLPTGLWLTLPLVAFLALFFLFPLSEIVRQSFLDDDGGLTTHHYVDFLETPAYRTILLRTLTTALLATVFCILIAFPYAYLMTLVSGKWRAVMLGVVLVPFWTSMLARTYAWLVLLQDSGPVRGALGTVGLEPQLLRNTTGVLIGMVHILLPFMVLPLYNGMLNIDRRLVLAARVLGASPRSAFFRVFLPLSVPGTVAGAVMVYVLALGFFLTPAILGSPQNALLSELVVQEVSEQLDWGSAGAMATILIVLTLLILAVGARVTRLGDAFGQGGAHGR